MIAVKPFHNLRRKENGPPKQGHAWAAQAKPARGKKKERTEIFNVFFLPLNWPK